MLKLKLQYFGHLMRRVDSLEKTLMLGGVGGRRRGWQRMRWLDGITNSMDVRVWVNSGSWWWTGRPGVLRFMGSQRVGHDWATELNWNLPNKTHPQPSALLIVILNLTLYYTYLELVSSIFTSYPSFRNIKFRGWILYFINTTNICICYISAIIHSTHHFW